MGMKSKGNTLEYDVLFTFVKNGYEGKVLNSNEKGVDVIIKNYSNGHNILIECKNYAKPFNWNIWRKIFDKTETSGKKLYPNDVPMVMVKTSRTPLLVMYSVGTARRIGEFNDIFNFKFEHRPKGLNLGKLLNENKIFIS